MIPSIKTVAPMYCKKRVVIPIASLPQYPCLYIAGGHYTNTAEGDKEITACAGNNFRRLRQWADAVHGDGKELYYSGIY
jgi:hypothetical protein